MVFINSKKFACESCIKGHRSSACAHTERPLFEIKKKGRPVSQCPKCRELRATRKVHSKCTCNETDAPVASTSTAAPAPAPKRVPGKRFVPIVPALPNGLKDYVGASTSTSKTIPQDKRNKVDSLLNPCTCGSFNCRCGSIASDNRREAAEGLTVLAIAAERLEPSSSSCCAPPIQRSITPPNPGKPAKRAKTSHTDAPSSCCSVLPADFEDPFADDDVVPAKMPYSPSCTCGTTCSCPGCTEHRGSEHFHGTDCAEGHCSTCVDWRGGVALPDATSFHSDPTPSSSSEDVFARFLRQAASLPQPPKSRIGLGPSLDPSNVTPDFFAFAQQQDLARVSIPRLECCNGNCGCPDGTCGCGKTCDGCCTSHAAASAKGASNVQKDTAKPTLGAKEKSLDPVNASSPLQEQVQPVLKSCCAGK